jgi:Putative esterase
MVHFMNIRVEFCNEPPDALIVGIGYPVTGTLTDMLYRVMHLRMRDFVLDREESGEAFMQEYFPIAPPIPSGNGLGFMQFLRQELIPLIESDYRADPADRTLLGHSMGANFALYTLFRPASGLGTNQPTRPRRTEVTGRPADNATLRRPTHHPPAFYSTATKNCHSSRGVQWFGSSRLAGLAVALWSSRPNRDASEEDSPPFPIYSELGGLPQDPCCGGESSPRSQESAGLMAIAAAPPRI